MREPCEHCPWRVGVDAWAIGRDHTLEVPPLNHFEMVGISRRQSEQIGQAPMMECHLSRVDAADGRVDPVSRVCAGFALQVGDRNVNFRVLYLIHKPVFACFDELHEDFGAMLAANPERTRS